VYAVAWACDALLASFLSFLVVLILVPEARGFCFPPAPPSLIDGTTGGAKKPMAGVLGSGDSLTGAPEKHPGEAVEQEAHSFVSSVITVSGCSEGGGCGFGAVADRRDAACCRAGW